MPPTLDDALLTLQRWFGYSSLRPPQRRAISAVLARRDVLVVMPTGGGKSLCFQVPAMMLDGLTIVLSPLVSLMKDQVDTLVRKGMPAVGLHGGMTPGQQADAIAAAINGSARMLYVAPERLVVGSTLRAIARVKVSLLAVDEAHCISEWGHEFRPAYRELQSIRGPLGSPPVIALTATATPAVRDDISAVCGLRNPVRISAGFDRPNLRYAVHRVSGARDRDHRLAELIRRRTGPAVVYAQTRSRVVRVARRLVASGVPAVPYHAGQEAGLRRETQDAFMRGAVEVIVATSAFGMGVDKSNVRLVVHDAISATLESYYQEAGRAGRDGQPSECVLLYAPYDRKSPEYFIAATAPPRQLVERIYLAAQREVDELLPGCPAWIDAGALARRLKAPPAQISGALSLLVRAGAVAEERGDPKRVWVRLMATDQRLRALRESESFDRHLVRELWRASRGAIRSGAMVDVASLQPGLGGVGLASALDAMMRDAMLVWERPHAGMRLADPTRDLVSWGIDWAGAAARRKVSEARLAAMIRYAETRGCRRRILLGYFGDVVESPNCGACDRCT